MVSAKEHLFAIITYPLVCVSKVHYAVENFLIEPLEFPPGNHGAATQSNRNRITVFS